MIGSALLNIMYGDPTNQITRTLNPGGPNPNPGASPSNAPGAAPGGPQTPGASGGPSGAPSAGPPQPQPPMAPANATQSPPDLAALYVQLHQRDQAANSIDRGTALMASAFGTAQQQHDMMNYAQSIGADDSTAALSKGILAQREMTKNQADQQAMQEHNRFVAGAAGMSKLLGDTVTPEQAQWLALNPDVFNEVLKTHQQVEAEKAKPTEAMKNAEAETAQWQASHPNATPQEIADHHATTLSGQIPGPGQIALNEQARAAQKFKDDAMDDYGSVNNTLLSNEDRVKQLLADMPSTMAALKDPDILTKGALAPWLPIASQSTKDQAALIDQLKAGLTGDNLKNVKNVRNQREFDTLGKALTGALTGANSEAQVRAALEDMQKKFLDAHATNEMAAGHHLTGNLVGHGQQDLLSPTLSNGQKNPFYNGATQDERPSGGGGGGKTYTYNPKTGQLE